MIRLFRVYHPIPVAILLVSELWIITGSFVVAALLLFRQDTYMFLRAQGFETIAVFAATCVIMFQCFDLYNLKNSRPVGATYFRLLLALALAAFSLAAVEKVFPDLVVSHGVVPLATILFSAGLIGYRSLFLRLCQSSLFREPVLVLSDATAAVELKREIARRPDWGWELITFDPDRGVHQDGRGNGSDGQSLCETVRQLGVRRVVVALHERRGRLPVNELVRLRTSGIVVEDAASILEKLTGRIDIRFASPGWLAFSSGFKISRFRMLEKRLFSILVSSVLGIVAFPAVILISILIKLDSKGPVLIRQDRVGQSGRVFQALKFRSMVEAAATSGFEPAHANDRRITRVGRFLRRWHVDELPQLVNIIRGEMSFVGPRPFVPEWEQDLEQKIPFYSLRHMVKPGLTGWAQINRGYCETVEDNREKLELDLFYIKNMSPVLDLWIIFQTVKIVLLNDWPK